jgi:tetratricopeptide (TPR) repeat protein
MKHATTLIVIASAVLTSTSVFPLHANADEGSQVQYEMVVVGNDASGNLVSRGDYELAVNRITGRNGSHPYAAATNLCVAYSMLGQFDQAEPKCDEAINAAENSPAGKPRNWKGRNQLATQHAFAYSNRGVMRILSGNVIGAEEDFRTALERKPNLRAPTQNLAKTQVETTAPIVAKVGQ